MTTPGGAPPEPVRVLNGLLAARSWDDAQLWLQPSSPSVSRWAAHRCLIGASGAHGRGEIAQRDVYAWSALAILCALDAGQTFDQAVWREIGAWWSWTCHRHMPRPVSFTLERYLKVNLPEEDLSSLISCTSDAEAAWLLDDLPGLWTLGAAAAVAVAGFDAASAGAPSAEVIFLSAAMVVERLPPTASNNVPLTRLHEDAPELRALLLSAAVANQALRTSDTSDIHAVQAWANVFAHPASRDLTSGARAGFLSEAADAVLSLYETSGIPAACDWTLKLAELALAVPDFPAAARRVVETRRCRALVVRYQRLKDDNDLNKAITAYERMLDTAADDEERRVAVNNLALALRSRAIASGSERTVDLDKAMELLEPYVTEILSESDHIPDQPDPGLLTNYSLILTSRFRLLPGRSEDERLAELYTAVEASQKAVASARRTGLNLLDHMRQLANARFELNGIRPPEQDWPSVSQIYEDAWRGAARLGPHPEMSVSHEWGRSASSRDDWLTANRAFGYALQAFDAVLRRQPASVLRTHELPYSYGLAAETALAKIMLAEKTGQRDLLRDAALVLERLRAVQLSASIASPATGQLPTRTGDRNASTNLARIVRRNDDLERALASEEDPARGLKGLAQLAMAVKEYTAAADALLGGLRPAPSHADSDKTNVSSGPATPWGLRTVVYLGAATSSGFALLAYPDGPRFDAVLLPGLTNDHVVDQALIYGVPAQPADRWESVLVQTSQWLWSNIMGPLLGRLGPDLDAIWVVPTWVLGTFPLHAARVEPESRLAGPDVLDTVAISYLPAARLLRSPSHDTPARPAPGRLVILAVPISPTMTGQSAERREAFAVAAAWPGSPPPRPPQDITREAVLDAFAHAEVLHLICHGEADPEHPLRSVVYLANNQTISLQDLLETRSSLRLAVLAACDTAVIGHGDYDEALGLPSALLAAGCRGVISALWQVPDLSSAVLFARFYELWPRVHDHPAQALRQAQRWLRSATSGEISDRYQSLYPPPGKNIPSIRQERWRSRIPFANPDHWAGFIYTGG